MANPTVVELPSYSPPIGAQQQQLRNGIEYPKINGATEISEGTIFAQALVVGQQTWIHNLEWTVEDYNTVTWSAGTLQLSGGGTYSILAGSSGNISGTSYIYFNSTNTLQITTTYTEAISENNILLATISPADDTDARALFTPYNSPGTTISGNQITTGRIQSNDNRTVFDLDNQEFYMLDADNDKRLKIGFKP